MGNSREGAGYKVGRGKPPVEHRFKPGQSGNPAGKVPGTISLGTRIRRLLDGSENLPPAISETIRKAVGADKNALDAMIIAGTLQALQGDKSWAQLLWEHMEGKPVASVALTDAEGGPVTFTLKIDNG